jgi:uncharacterized membrane protein YphA (DoxX/SURF4 family)
MPSTNASWTLAQKVSFRFFCCLFVLYIFPFPLNFIQDFVDSDSEGFKFLSWYFKALDLYSKAWHAMVPWVGDHILHLKNPITIFTNGSGDTTYDYVALFTTFVLAFLSAAIWCLFDRKRPSYRQADYWLRVLVRYNLAVLMLSYGFSKIYHLQMGSPYLSELVEKFGNKSPMGLAWSFFGYSPAYSAFTGFGEVLGGSLLFLRRTTTLGSLVLVVVLSNIVAINFCYDIPVKLFSSMLLLMNIFLLSPDIRGLVQIFISKRAYSLKGLEFSWNTKKSHRIALILKSIFILSCFGVSIWSSLKMSKIYGDQRPLPKLYGIYNVQTFIRNKDTIPPLLTDSTRWKMMLVQNEGYARFSYMNDKVRWMRFIIDSAMKKATVFSTMDTSKKSYFNILPIDSSYLALVGKLNSDSLYVRLKKLDPKTFTLIGRGFHWINEYPLNR